MRAADRPFARRGERVGAAVAPGDGDGPRPVVVRVAERRATQGEQQTDQHRLGSAGADTRRPVRRGRRRAAHRERSAARPARGGGSRGGGPPPPPPGVPRARPPPPGGAARRWMFRLLLPRTAGPPPPLTVRV